MAVHDPNTSSGFLLTICMGIVAVAGMPEARINLQLFCSFFKLALNFGCLSSASIAILIVFFCPCRMALIPIIEEHGMIMMEIPCMDHILGGFNRQKRILVQNRRSTTSINY